MNTVYNMYIYTCSLYVSIDAKGMKAGLRWCIGFHRVCQRLMGFCWTACSLKSLIGIFRRATKVLAIARVNDAATTGSWNHHFSSTTGAGFSSTTGAWQKRQKIKKKLEVEGWLLCETVATSHTYDMVSLADGILKHDIVTFVVGEVALLNSGSGSGRLTSLELHGSTVLPPKKQENTWLSSLFVGDFQIRFETPSNQHLTQWLAPWYKDQALQSFWDASWPHPQGHTSEVSHPQFWRYRELQEGPPHLTGANYEQKWTNCPRRVEQRAPPFKLWSVQKFQYS